MQNTNIEWCDSTFNPWIGCTKVGPGCDNCYAKADFDDRKHRVTWGAGQARSRTKTWGDPVKWNAQPFFECAECSRECRWRGACNGQSCPECGGHVVLARQRVFCASLADVFDNEVDPKWRADLFDLILATPNLDWLLLTKRIGNARKMLNDVAVTRGALLTVNDEYRPPANVWLGATVVNQEEADRDIPKLLATPARVRFLSMEPLLGPVDLKPHLLQCCGCFEEGHPGSYWEPPEGPSCCNQPESTDLHWVIAGGESGLGARPSHPDWYRSLRDQCAAAGVPFLFKQWGEWIEPDVDGMPVRLTARVGDPEFFTSAAEMDGFLCIDGRFERSVNDLADDVPYLGMKRIGKKAANRLLDGIKHNGFPA